MSNTETWRIVEIKEGGQRNVLQENIPANVRHQIESTYQDLEGDIRLEREGSNAE